MAWDPAIPKSTDKMNVSQPELQANFQALNTFFTVNHQNFNLKFAGNHLAMQFPIQAVAPTTGTIECALFTRAATNPAVAGRNVLCLKQPLENLRPSEIIEFSDAGLRWARLPCGLLIKWETFDIPAATGFLATNTLCTWSAVANVDVAFTAPPLAIFLTQVNLSAVANINAYAYVLGNQSPATSTYFYVHTEAKQGLTAWNAFRVYAVALGLG